MSTADAQSFVVLLLLGDSDDQLRAGEGLRMHAVPAPLIQ